MGSCESDSYMNDPFRSSVNNSGKSSLKHQVCTKDIKSNPMEKKNTLLSISGIIIPIDEKTKSPRRPSKTHITDLLHTIISTIYISQQNYGKYIKVSQDVEYFANQVMWKHVAENSRFEAYKYLCSECINKYPEIYEIIQSDEFCQYFMSALTDD